MKEAMNKATKLIIKYRNLFNDEIMQDGTAFTAIDADAAYTKINGALADMISAGEKITSEIIENCPVYSFDDSSFLMVKDSIVYITGDDLRKFRVNGPIVVGGRRKNDPKIKSSAIIDNKQIANTLKAVADYDGPNSAITIIGKFENRDFSVMLIRDVHIVRSIKAFMVVVNEEWTTVRRSRFSVLAEWLNGKQGRKMIYRSLYARGASGVVLTMGMPFILIKRR